MGECDSIGAVYSEINWHRLIRRAGRPNPLVAAHCEDLAIAEGLVIIHPNWWGGPPAILKGWVDRVMRAGLAYQLSAEGVPKGLLQASRALVLNTSEGELHPDLQRRGHKQ